MVLGGLIDEDAQESVSKVPLLGDIPLLGGLFTSTNSSKKKRNLMVFIRPSIVRDQTGMSYLSERKIQLYAPISCRKSKKISALCRRMARCCRNMAPRRMALLACRRNCRARRLSLMLRPPVESSSHDRAACANCRGAGGGAG